MKTGPEENKMLTPNVLSRPLHTPKVETKAVRLCEKCQKCPCGCDRNASDSDKKITI